ncbi:MAG: pyridoxamine 5'-phosphate oxidase family protein [Acidimicrobiia bacterium]|nr:pyridoxamine 5'-phosphate oxidase family protein [Acidimicrobiia bacterium]
MTPPDTSTEAREAVQLILAGRWAALATTGDRGPLASMVSYAPEPGLQGLLMFLSRLARHTRNLAIEPSASLAISMPDRPDVIDPQTLPRVSVQGPVEPIERADPAFTRAWSIYVERLPTAAPRLQLGDFTLFRLIPEDVRYVGGFAAARTIRGDALRAATVDPE